LVGQLQRLPPSIRIGVRIRRNLQYCKMRSATRRNSSSMRWRRVAVVRLLTTSSATTPTPCSLSHQNRAGGPRQFRCCRARLTLPNCRALNSLATIVPVGSAFIPIEAAELALFGAPAHALQSGTHLVAFAHQSGSLQARDFLAVDQSWTLRPVRRGPANGGACSQLQRRSVCHALVSRGLTPGPGSPGSSVMVVDQMSATPVVTSRHCREFPGRRHESDRSSGGGLHETSGHFSMRRGPGAIGRRGGLDILARTRYASVVIVFFALAGMVLTLVLAAQPLALRAGRDR
jgi:hypothetical protein